MADGNSGAASDANGKDPAQASSAAAGSGFSLSFASRGRQSAASSRAKPSAQQPEERELIVGFASGQSEAADKRAPVQRGKLVIPLQLDTFQGAARGPKAHNPDRYLPDRDDGSRLNNEDRFELAAPENKPTMAFGLQQRSKPQDAAQQPDVAQASGREDAQPGTSGQLEAGVRSGVNVRTAVGTEGAPGGLRIMKRPGQGPRGTENGHASRGAGRGGGRGRAAAQEADLDILRTALADMPDVASLDDYEAIPVEEFGRAMLYGMGWTEGKAMCKRDMPDVVAPEYVKRPDKLGLGAQPGLPPDTHKKCRHPGDSQKGQPPRDLVYIDPSGRQRNVKPAGAELTKRVRPGARAGKRMRVLAGSHSGLVCTVLDVQGDPPVASVRLHPTMSSPEKDAYANGHSKYHRKEKKRHKKESKKERKRRKKDHKRGKAPSEEASSSSGSDEEAALPQLPVGGTERPWLMPHIMVKIIDKHRKGGRLYLKRAEGMDE
ncbi:hypothetical protein WJX73_005228 [Symbiochloris irregularis]|uniref:Spp2/MOS2 G-patch domain-containing protein n=1 Tax=Symbiochloris irregularis TaxID=706552 RepID=A0AAW1PEB7_9CHLO